MANPRNEATDRPAEMTNRDASERGMAADNQRSARKKGGRAAAWCGLLLTLAGPIVYYTNQDNAWLRSTGLLAWILMGAGLLLSLSASIRHPRWMTRIPAAVGIGWSGLFLLFFFVGSALPEVADGVAEAGRKAPGFERKDHNGNTVKLSVALASGPVHLVFYRGYW